MNLLRPVRIAGVLGLVAVGLSGCLSEPSYSTTPSISFESIRKERYIINGSPVDSVYIKINFQDGDGDLGVSSTEAGKLPYSARYQGANFYVTPFLKNSITGKFDSLKTLRPDLYLIKSSYYDRFDHLSTTTDNRASPLRGTLIRRYGFAYGDQYRPNQEAKFTVSILDRALHQSNEI
ncbi:MAG: hypothetical protein EOO36_18300, partial [Cytophagaceae bacterium]